MSGMLGLLGLGARAGNLMVGVDGVRSVIQRGRCELVILAADAGPRAQEKVARLARARGVPLVQGPEAAVLGRQLGRPPVMAVGVLDPALARGISAAAQVNGMTEE